MYHAYLMWLCVRRLRATSSVEGVGRPFPASCVTVINTFLCHGKNSITLHAKYLRSFSMFSETQGDIRSALSTAVQYSFSRLHIPIEWHLAFALQGHKKSLFSKHIPSVRADIYRRGQEFGTATTSQQKTQYADKSERGRQMARQSAESDERRHVIAGKSNARRPRLARYCRLLAKLSSITSVDGRRSAAVRGRKRRAASFGPHGEPISRATERTTLLLRRDKLSTVLSRRRSIITYLHRPALLNNINVDGTSELISSFFF